MRKSRITALVGALGVALSGLVLVASPATAAAPSSNVDAQCKDWMRDIKQSEVGEVLKSKEVAVAGTYKIVEEIVEYDKLTCFIYYGKGSLPKEYNKYKFDYSYSLLKKGSTVTEAHCPDCALLSNNNVARMGWENGNNFPTDMKFVGTISSEEMKTVSVKPTAKQKKAALKKKNKTVKKAKNVAKKKIVKIKKSAKSSAVKKKRIKKANNVKKKQVKKANNVYKKAIKVKKVKKPVATKKLSWTTKI